MQREAMTHVCVCMVVLECEGLVVFECAINRAFSDMHNVFPSIHAELFYILIGLIPHT